MKFAFAFFAVIILQGFFVINADESIVIMNNSTDSQFETSNETTTTIPITTITPAPAEGHFRLNYTSNNQYCIMMDVSTLELDITYPNMNGSRSTKTFHAPSTTTVVPFFSRCGANLTNDELDETLALNIPGREILTSPFITLMFDFTRQPNITGDKSLDKSQLYKIRATYTYDPINFPDIDPREIRKIVQVVSNGTLKEFAVLHDRSYQCNSASSIKVDDKLTLKFTGLRVQAFIPNNHLDTPEPCPADAQTSDLIPIVIGAVLAAIVLIVLIAYLIGRARMRRTTYESI